MNAFPTLVCLGFSEAGMFLRNPDAARVQAIISIHGENEFGVEATVPHRLNLVFDDVESPDPSDLFAVYHATMRRRADEENGLHRCPPTVEDAQAIIEFATAIRALDGLVLCHCSGGVSRSPAAALLCLATWTGPGRERECVELLRAIRPCASPHQDLVRFGDRILNRHGLLSAAISATTTGETL